MKAGSRALACEAVANVIKVVVVVAQSGDMDKSLYMNVVEFHKQAEVGHRDYRAVKTVADVLLDVLALEPVGNIITGGICAAFTAGQVLPQFIQLTWLVRINPVGGESFNALDLCRCGFFLLRIRWRIPRCTSRSG